MDLPERLFMDPVLGVAVPLFFVFIGLEIYVRQRQQRKAYDNKDAWASLAMGFGSAIINLGVKVVVFLVFSFIHQYAIFDIGSQWWAWLLLFLADDFSFYLHHRSCHEIRLFWAAHVNHHSSQQYNLAVALRQSWGELFHKYIWYLWLPLVGFHPLMVLTMMSISLVYQFFLHTETVHKFPRIVEFIFNTPSHHRVHHGSNVRYLDRNHAGILIIWDRLLGTFEPEREEEPVEYGLTTNIATNNPFRIATHEYAQLLRDLQKSPKWGDKWRYVFAPPGWSHDGSTLTANQMRKQISSSSTKAQS